MNLIQEVQHWMSSAVCCRNQTTVKMLSSTSCCYVTVGTLFVVLCVIFGTSGYWESDKQAAAAAKGWGAIALGARSSASVSGVGFAFAAGPGAIAETTGGGVAIYISPQVVYFFFLGLSLTLIIGALLYTCGGVSNDEQSHGIGKTGKMTRP